MFVLNGKLQILLRMSENGSEENTILTGSKSLEAKVYSLKEPYKKTKKAKKRGMLRTMEHASLGGSSTFTREVLLSSLSLATSNYRPSIATIKKY